MRRTFIIGAICCAIAAPALASSIVTTDGHLCPADTVCSPIDAGAGSAGFIHHTATKDGFGYLAIQFGDNPPAEGFITFLLSSAPTYLQFCGFNVGHSTQGYEWPLNTQIEWYSSQPVGSKWASTAKYRTFPGSLTPGGVYAFTFACSVAAPNP